MKKDTEVPSKAAWGELRADDLDVHAAYKDFFGKSNSEIQQAYTNCAIEMADSLRWMPPNPFRYYIKGFAQFILGGNFHEFDAADAASSFLRLIEDKLRKQPDSIAPAIDEVLSAVEYLANNQMTFGADPDIYGVFIEKRKVIEELWAAYISRRK